MHTQKNVVLNKNINSYYDDEFNGSLEGFGFANFFDIVGGSFFVGSYGWGVNDLWASGQNVQVYQDGNFNRANIYADWGQVYSTGFSVEINMGGAVGIAEAYGSIVGVTMWQSDLAVVNAYGDYLSVNSYGRTNLVDAAMNNGHITVGGDWSSISASVWNFADIRAYYGDTAIHTTGGGHVNITTSYGDDYIKNEAASATINAGGGFDWIDLGPDSIEVVTIDQRQLMGSDDLFSSTVINGFNTWQDNLVLGGVDLTSYIDQAVGVMQDAMGGYAPSEGVNLQFGFAGAEINLIGINAHEDWLLG